MSSGVTPPKVDAATPAAPTQRRARVRYRCAPATLGRLFIANSYKSMDAWLVNLSLSGTGLVLDGPLEPESWVTIELENKQRQMSVEVNARIVHSTVQADGTWAIGCAFARDLSEDELDAML